MTRVLTADTDTDAEFARIVDELTRRGFLAGGLGAAGLFGLAACGSSGQTAAPSNPAAGPWTFTDDLARQVTLPARPTRIVSLWDSLTISLWPMGLHVVATQQAPSNAGYLRAAGVPGSGVSTIGIGGTGKIDVEKLAAAKPDLILDTAAGGGLSAAGANKQIAQVAPVIGLSQAGPDFQAVIDHERRLLTALQLDPTDSAGQQAYRTARQNLAKEIAAKPGLRVAMCWYDDSSLYLYNPPKIVFTQTLTELGMRFSPVRPSAAFDDDFEQLSWELAPSLPIDLLLLSTSNGPLPTSPAWKAMPAVKAGQYAITDTWGAGPNAYFYANYATVLNDLTTAVANAKEGVGPR